MEPTPSSLPTVEDRQSQALQLFAFPMELDGQKPFAILCFCRWVSSLVSVLVLFLFLCFCMREKKKRTRRRKKREIKSFQLKMVGSDLSKVSKSCDIQQLVCCAGISAWLWEGQQHPCAAISSTMSEISVVLHRELTITPGYPGAALLAHKK